MDGVLVREMNYLARQSKNDVCKFSVTGVPVSDSELRPFIFSSLELTGACHSLRMMTILS